MLVSKMKTLCVLPYEIKHREFDSRLRLSMELAVHGFPVLLGNKNHVDSIAEGCGKPVLYFSKGLNDECDDFYKSIVDNKGRIVNLDEESSINLTNDAYDFFYLLRNEPRALQYVSLHLPWSQREQEKLLRYRPQVLKEQTSVCGNVRFDLLHPRYDGFRDPHETSMIPKEKFILVPTSFGAGNSILEDELWLQKAVGRAKDPQHEIFFRRKLEYQKKLVRHYLATIPRLAQRFPQYVFVVRPHPVERLETYADAFKTTANITVIREGSILQWLKHAELVLHSECTTGIEAMYGNKRVIAYLPVYDERVARDYGMATSEVVRTEQELFEAIAAQETWEFTGWPSQIAALMHEQGALPPTSPPAVKATVEAINTHHRKWYAGGCSHEYLPELLAAHVPASANDNQAEAKTLSPLKKAILAVLGLFRRQDKRQQLYNRYKLAKYQSLTTGEVERKMELFRAIDPYLSSCRSERLCRETYLITANQTTAEKET